MVYNIADNFLKHNIRFPTFQEATGFSSSQHGMKINLWSLKGAMCKICPKF